MSNSNLMKMVMLNSWKNLLTVVITNIHLTNSNTVKGFINSNSFFSVEMK
jgi:hypothetical protein